MDLSPTEWGPSYWYIIHLLSYTFEEDKYDHYRDFFSFLKIFLPCDVCRPKYLAFLEQYPFEENSTPSEFLEWTLKMHNYINRALKKREYTLEELDELYIRDNRLQIDTEKLREFLNYVALYFKIITENSEYYSFVDQLEQIYNKFFLCLIFIYPDKEYRLYLRNVYTQLNK